METNDTAQTERLKRAKRIKNNLLWTLNIITIAVLIFLFSFASNSLGTEAEYREKYYDKAIDYSISGFYQAATEQLTIFLKHYPEDYNGNYQMGMDLMQLNKPSEARPYFVRAYRSDFRKIHRWTGYGNQRDCKAMIKKIDQMTQNKHNN